ncbi:hypothetical protein IIA95_03860 [Patescibacteria group bacterium]|nr:hypothetical protein [Patescibacteria group bacterium]
MSETQDNYKEGLKEIISKLPFTPTLPIKRKEFFVGILLIVVAALVINLGLTVLLGGMNFFIAAGFGIIFSYVMATWYTKRFLDIRPTTNARVFQIAFFILILVLNILTYIQADMMSELKALSDYISMNGLEAVSGAPEVSAITEMYAVPVSFARAVMGIPLLLFVLFLLFKRGKSEKQEVKNKNL